MKERDEKIWLRWASMYKNNPAKNSLTPPSQVESLWSMTLLRDTRPLISLVIAMALAASACTSASVSVSPAPPKCQVSLAPSTAAVNAEGGTSSVAVTTERECSWTVTSEASWITIASPASGQGGGTVEYRVAANLEPAARSGAIVVNDQRAAIAQAGGCRFTIAPVSQAVADTGGTASVAVTAPAGTCTWTAVSGASWITITGGSSGTGNGTVNFTVAANSPANPRTGTLTVAGQTATVIQGALDCSASINPVAQSVAAAGGPGTAIAVTALTGCAWTATSGAPWITNVTPDSGTGNGTVNFTVGANPAATARTGTLTIAGQTATVTQNTPGCSYTINPTSQSVAAAGGAGSAIAVTTIPGCAWTATSGAPWLTNVTPGSGTGSGTVNFTIGANPAAIARTGTLTVAGTAFTVTQQGAACSYSINPTSQSVAAAGGAGSAIAVTTIPGCAWTATSDAPWITNVTPGNGTGSGTVNFTIGANPAAIVRTGTLTVAGTAFTVTQQAAACSYSINPTSQSVAAAGGAGSAIAVTTIPGCAWTATSGAPWLTNVTPGSGTGSGTVNFTIGANPAAIPRTGTLTVAGTAFTVTQQAAACSSSINPTSQSVAAAGGAGSAIAVTTIPGCAWTATSGAPWITNVTPGGGTGSGTVNFTIGANPAAIPRTGTLTVAGTAFTVTQQGAACSSSINPTSQSVAAAGGAGSPIAVTTIPGCAWTATSGAPWITNVTPGGGTGSGTVNFAIGANPAGIPRTGTLTVAGTPFTVTQQGVPCSYSINPTSQLVAAGGGPGARHGHRADRVRLDRLERRALDHQRHAGEWQRWRAREFHRRSQYRALRVPARSRLRARRSS